MRRPGARRGPRLEPPRHVPALEARASPPEDRGAGLHGATRQERGRAARPVRRPRARDEQLPQRRRRPRGPLEAGRAHRADRPPSRPRAPSRRRPRDLRAARAPPRVRHDHAGLRPRLHVLHRAVHPRARGVAPARGRPGGGRAPRGRRRARGHVPRAERQHVRQRPARRGRALRAPRGSRGGAGPRPDPLPDQQPLRHDGGHDAPLRGAPEGHAVAAHPRAVGERRGARAHEADLHGRPLPRGRRLGAPPRRRRRDHVGLHRGLPGRDRRGLREDAAARRGDRVRPVVRLQVQRAAEHPRREAPRGRRPRGGEARPQPRVARRPGPPRRRGQPRAPRALRRGAPRRDQPHRRDPAQRSHAREPARARDRPTRGSSAGSPWRASRRSRPTRSRGTSSRSSRPSAPGASGEAGGARRPPLARPPPPGATPRSCARPWSWRRSGACASSPTRPSGASWSRADGSSGGAGTRPTEDPTPRSRRWRRPGGTRAARPST